MSSQPKTPCQLTEVIAIGNGPSAICLSFFLSGQRPFYNGMRHPNEFLHYKLSQNPDVSIVEQDLEYLCEGLEGRSPNPVSLLLDTLTHADADIGANHPSFLTWKKDDTLAVPHVVLGKGAAGGTWQAIEGDMHTLSLSSWMELPNLSFSEWLSTQKGQRIVPSSSHYERAKISDLRKYYSDYIRTNNLDKYFRDNCTVTSARKVYNMRTCTDDESGEILPCCQNVKKNHRYVWEVRGYHLSTNQNGSTIRTEFCHLAPKIVLATGSFDIANRLHTPGEDLPYVLHTTKQYENVIKRTDFDRSKPVVVIGAGLTAGDAIIMSNQHNIPVEHVFRRNANDSRLIYRQLPKALYPEYHRIHEMMKRVGYVVEVGSASYQPHAAHTVVEFTDDRKVIIQNNDQEKIIHCSYAVVLVGTKADLSFLPDKGRNLGVVPKKLIHSYHNPLDIDPYSYQSVHEPGLYAIGPLVGDTFVRFVRGGALGITADLWRKLNDDNVGKNV